MFLKSKIMLVSIKKILWLDAGLGGATGAVGILHYHPLESILGLPESLIVIVSVVTLCYAIVALILATQSSPSMRILRILVYANWFWTIVSIGLVAAFYADATILGKAFLILQVLVLAGLAYVEGRLLRDQPQF